jgi:hypothetical protein
MKVYGIFSGVLFFLNIYNCKMIYPVRRGLELYMKKTKYENKTR